MISSHSRRANSDTTPHCRASRHLRRLALLATTVSLICSHTACTHVKEAAATPTQAAVSSLAITQAADQSGSPITPYPFDTCAVIQKPLNGQPKYRRVYQSQEVLFCCTPCVKAFDAAPDGFMPRIKEAALALQGELPGAHQAE